MKEKQSQLIQKKCKKTIIIIKEILREHHEQLIDNKLDNLEEVCSVVKNPPAVKETQEL